MLIIIQWRRDSVREGMYQRLHTKCVTKSIAIRDNSVYYLGSILPNSAQIQSISFSCKNFTWLDKLSHEIRKSIGTDGSMLNPALKTYY